MLHAGFYSVSTKWYSKFGVWPPTDQRDLICKFAYCFLTGFNKIQGLEKTTITLPYAAKISQVLN